MMTKKFKSVVDAVDKWVNDRIDETLNGGHSEDYKKFYLSHLLQDPLVELGGEMLGIFMHRAGYSERLVAAVFDWKKQGYEFSEKVKAEWRYTPSDDRLVEELTKIRDNTK